MCGNERCEKALKRFGMVMLFVVVILFWLAYGYWYMPGTDAKLGIHGDKFGGLNTLFTGLAFAGFILALFYQVKQLKNQSKQLDKQSEMLEIQREDLKLQREEMVATRKVLNLQKEALEKQVKVQQLMAQMSSSSTALGAFLDIAERRSLSVLSKWNDNSVQEAIETSVDNLHNIHVELSG